MSRRRKNLFIIFGIALLSILTRLLFIYTIPYDSDEITWSIIGRRVLSGEDFHIFFLNQKYMGAIEGYIVGIFQALFGYNLITLRINSLIFSTILSITIYLILKKLTGPKTALLGPLLFNLASYDVTSNYTKAWGNRPFVSLVGLLVVYACWYLFLSKEKITSKKRVWISSLTGLLLGLSFWANLENVYFIVIAFAMFISGIVMIKTGEGCIRRNAFARSGDARANGGAAPGISWTQPSIKNIISFMFYILLFWLFYMLAAKKALFNPYETLSVKFNLKGQGLQFLNYSFETALFLLLFYIIAPIKLLLFPARDKNLKSFSLLFSFFMLGAYFTISRNSIERANQIDETFREQYNFLTNAILPLFFGTALKTKTFALIMIFPLTSLFISLCKVIKLHRIKLEDAFCFYYLIPLLFFISKAGGINSSSRYITNMWPGFVVLFVCGFYRLFRQKSWILRVATTSVLIFFIYRNYAIYPKAFASLKQRYHTKTDYIKSADYLVSKDVKGCYAGYWNAYPIMFESDYKVICSPSPHFGYGENETPFNTLIVDKMDNPAFVFTTQKRVDEFFRRWVDKEIEITEEKRVGRYFIFLTTRIK